MPYEAGVKRLAVRTYSEYSVLICILIAAFSILGWCSNSSNEPGRAQTSADNRVLPQQSPKGTLFYVSSYVGKCLDFGTQPQTARAPVYLYPCNSTAAQQVRVEEINSRHEVVLHAGNLVIGVHNPPTNSTGGPPPPPPSEYSLELQPEANQITTTFLNQVFALDGDSIIWTANRNYVVQIKNAQAVNRTPLILGKRNLADSEFWDFSAVDGGAKDPTTGFKRVSTREELLIAIGLINQNARQGDGTAWGNVIEIINTGNPIVLTANPAYIVPNDNSYHNLVLPTGVTIRGKRRGTTLGPLLVGSYGANSVSNSCGNDVTCALILLNLPGAWTYLLDPDHMLEVEGDYVRITGLRVQGPNGGLSASLPVVDGIHIGNKCMSAQCLDPSGKGVHLGPPSHSGTFTGVIIDHNNLSQWPNAAIELYAGYDERGDGKKSDDEQECASPTYVGAIDSVLITRNFIHDNAKQGFGYGVAVGDDAGANILGNTFLMNRHSITGDGRLGDQYSAWDNLVLSRAPIYNRAQQDFDMHGMTKNSSHDGGIAGHYLEIAWNTFLGGNRLNFTLRGEPCLTDIFHNNVSRQDSGDAIEKWDYKGDSLNPTSSRQGLTLTNNQFSTPDPTVHLGVGDFDGDGIQDLFLATGAAWYYSSAGQTEWRFLNGGKTDRMNALLLGDFDGDGRTDVVGKNGNDLMISWAGVSDWQKLNSVTAPISDLAVGDFFGEGHTDIFWADGTNWYVSKGGAGPFTMVQTSSKKASELRFGRFCGTKATDVLAIEAGKWMRSCGAREGWSPMPVSLTSSMNGLLVAPSAGLSQGLAMRSGPLTWSFWYQGQQGWDKHQITSSPSCTPNSFAAIGRFSGNSADVMLWGNGLIFCLAQSGKGPTQRQSRQDMR